MEKTPVIDTMTLRQALAEIPPSGFDDAAFLHDEIVPHAPQSPEWGHATQRPAAARTPNHHEVHRRREIQELRSQVESLEQTLQLLSSRVPRGDAIAVISEATALKRECEDIVARQYAARVTAQIRNARLRKVFDDHQRTARKIKRLGQRLIALQITIPRLLESPTRHLFTLARVDPRVQVQRLPLLKREADAIFRSATFDSRERVTSRQFNLSSDHSEAVELTESTWVLPFAVEDVADAVWRQTTRAQMVSDQMQWLDIHADAASLVSQYLLISESEAKPSLKCGQIATYRESSTDGSVQLLTNVQMTRIDGGKCTTVFTSDVWARIEPLTTSHGSAWSRVLWCRRMRLLPPACRTVSERRRWIKSVVSGPARVCEGALLHQNRQALENALVTRNALRASTQRW